MTYAQLVEKLAAIGVDDKEVNIRNKLSRGKFTAAFFFAMSRGNRGAIFAVGLIIGVAATLLFLAWSFPGFRNPTYQDKRYSYATNDKTGEDNPVVRPSFWETYTSPADTYAQWIMAVLSFAATGVSLWAVILVRNSLELNRRATKAAEDAVAETRRIGEAQVRAHVSIVGGGVFMRGGSPSEVERGMRPIISIRVKNYGQTPAHWFQWAVIVRFLPPMDSEFRGSLDFPPASWGADIGVGEEKTLTLNHGRAVLTDAEWATFNQQQTALDVVVKYRFVDVLKNQIEDERVFACYFGHGEMETTGAILTPHPLDRATIEQQIATMRFFAAQQQ